MKRVFLLLAVVFVIGSVSAQVVWGIRAGASLPTLTASEGDTWEGQFGLEAGPVLYYSLQNNFYINAGALFNMNTFTEKDEDYKVSINISYIDIPVYLGYSIPLGGLDTYAQIGPYFGLKLSAKESWSYDGESESQDIEGITSFNAGIGAMYGININRFKFEVGYKQGLTNLIKDSGDYKLTLGSIFLGVSYVF